MHPNHVRTVSDLLALAREDGERLHVESGKMDGEDAIIVAAVGPLVAQVRRMLESEFQPVAPGTQQTLDFNDEGTRGGFERQVARNEAAWKHFGSGA